MGEENAPPKLQVFISFQLGRGGGIRWSKQSFYPESTFTDKKMKWILRVISHRHFFLLNFKHLTLQKKINFTISYSFWLHWLGVDILQRLALSCTTKRKTLIVGRINVKDWQISARPHHHHIYTEAKKLGLSKDTNFPTLLSQTSWWK